MLSSNRIGNQGADHLANALQQNAVISLHFLLIIKLLISGFLIQTLTTLYLGHTQINDQGVEHLANVLAQNEVT